MSTQTILNIDLNFYKNNNVDLEKYSDLQLIEHYSSYGCNEGRQAAALASRENLLKAIEVHRSVLEIGPFCAPTITSPNTKYMDIMSKSQLTERAIKIGIAVDKIPNIDFVSPTGSLAPIEEKFDAIFSSHCIEHQPNLVKHLNEVEDHLNPGGCYYMIIPDKRFCFDANLPHSKISDIIAAHYENPKTHSLSSVIEHRALTTHNDAIKHWSEKSTDIYREINIEKIKSAIIEYQSAKGGYIDVHAWQFTPISFKQNMTILAELGLINFSNISVYGTPHLRLEFVAVLTK